jgi:hypothetical protein
MSIHKVPENIEDGITVIVAVSSIALLLVIWLLSHDPIEISSSAKGMLAWAAMGIVFLVPISLASRESMSRLKRSYEFDLSDDQLIQRREGQVVEIAPSEIESLHDYRGWLIVEGGVPARKISIPPEVSGFEDLKRQLAAGRQVGPVKTRWRPILILLFPVAVFLEVCYLLFTSRNAAVILLTGAALLACQSWGVFSQWSRRKNEPRSWMLLLAWLGVLMITAWIIYRRVMGAI